MISKPKDSILPPLKWLSDQDPSIPENIRDWLMEANSMTLRLENYCTCIHVEPQRECFITRDKLKEEAQHLPVSSRYWLREVILMGDNQPWLLGRTVIPQETLLGHNQALMHLSTIPLGHYLFNSGKLTRDYIHIGQKNALWARRSRLRLANKPLLLTELFLAASPLYTTNLT
ncbi:chorismate lyase [Bartonella vinsonii]|uniref:chorismate lyase n=1 Tax=Bartonella vinsonii TaxID=33047 RepID=UPI0002B6CB51|nr:chorismate lyase [Bartonella vinsonii]AGF76092.1 chorismate--pyruvate lyase [Bartonella vinsonii subsp. berkhoffii str. Winnie]